jgi:hypothetical protein
MQILDGLKMIGIEDIILPAGRPAAICDFLFEQEQKGNHIINSMDSSLVLTIDTSLGEEDSLLIAMRPYKLIFIPLDFIEEKIITDSEISSYNEIKDVIITLHRSEKINKKIASCDDKLEKFLNKYPTRDSIMKTTCCMYIYEDNILKQVYTAIPNHIVNGVLNNCPSYICSKCGVIQRPDCHSFDNFIPDMWYRVIDNRIDYYCKKCKDKSMPHVGNR